MYVVKGHAYSQKITFKANDMIGCVLITWCRLYTLLLIIIRITDTVPEFQQLIVFVGTEVTERLFHVHSRYCHPSYIDDKKYSHRSITKIQSIKFTKTKTFFLMIGFGITTTSHHVVICCFVATQFSVQVKIHLEPAVTLTSYVGSENSKV